MTTPLDCKILPTVTSERQCLQSPVALKLNHEQSPADRQTSTSSLAGY